MQFRNVRDWSLPRACAWACIGTYGHGADGDGARGCAALRKLLVYCSSDGAWGAVHECRQVLQHLRVPLSLEGFSRAL